MENKYSFDGKFEGNIVIVGKTGCGKTTFIQKLASNNMFGNDISKVFWVSKICLNKEKILLEIVLKIKKFILVILKT